MIWSRVTSVQSPHSSIVQVNEKHSLKHYSFHRSFLMIKRAVEVMNSIKDPKLRNAFRLQLARYDRSYSMRLYVHATLFRETIWAQGTKEQFQKWADDIDHLRVYGMFFFFFFVPKTRSRVLTSITGCFALTELGHSSFIRGSETYAIYDKENQEFIINSGSLLATKWWIGGAGEVRFLWGTRLVGLCR